MSHQLAMFNMSNDLTNHMTEGSSNFMSGSSSLYAATLPSLVAIYILVVHMFLVCLVIKRNH